MMADKTETRRMLDELDEKDAKELRDKRIVAVVTTFVLPVFMGMYSNDAAFHRGYLYWLGALLVVRGIVTKIPE